MQGDLVSLILSIILFFFGSKFYKGDLSLLQQYHQDKVKDKKGYSHALGLLTIIFGLSMFISFILSLVLPKNSFTPYTLDIISSVIFIVIFIIIQIKYNRKI